MKKFVKSLEYVVMKHLLFKDWLLHNFKIYFTCFLPGHLSLEVSYSTSKK